MRMRASIGLRVVWARALPVEALQVPGGGRGCGVGGSRRDVRTATDRPIMPGVLQIEAMAQLGGFVALQPPLSEPGQDFFFGGVDNVKWRKPLVPGDVLVMEMHVTNFKKRFGICKMQGKGYVDGKVCLSAALCLSLALLPPRPARLHPAGVNQRKGTAVQPHILSLNYAAWGGGRRTGGG